MKNNKDNNIERPAKMTDIEHESPKQSLIFIGFLTLIVFILAGFFYLMMKEPERKVITKQNPNKVMGSDPGEIDLTLVEKEITRVPKKPEIIIPEPIEKVKLKNIANPTIKTKKPNKDYLRKLASGGMLSGSTRKKSSSENTKTKNSVSRVKAGRLKNLNYLITQGTKIDCTLETAIDSTIKGYTSCITSRDVYSANGNVILLDRGTKVVGKYESSLKHGQARIYVEWNRAVTPEGVTIELGSGGTGSLGRAGHDGFVNKHWWERFGNALLISIVSDSLGYVADKRNNKNYENTEATVNEFAIIAAKSGITIKPTININQGQSIIVYVQKDLDFSNVYNLKIN